MRVGNELKWYFVCFDHMKVYPKFVVFLWEKEFIINVCVSYLKKKKNLFSFCFIFFSYVFLFLLHAPTCVCFSFSFLFFPYLFPFHVDIFKLFIFHSNKYFFSKLSIRTIKPKRNQLWHKPLFECLFILQGSIRLCISCFSFHNTFVIRINMYLFSFLSLSFPFLCGNFQTFHSNTNYFY